MVREALVDDHPARHIDYPVQDPDHSFGLTVIRFTRLWTQYGIFGFAVLCIVIGAVESLFGR
jgi:hypothetical protein